MRERGFTLIELLAVIVILAIIAVITVPKIADMIESSRKGAAEDAFYGTIKAAELAWTKQLQSESGTAAGICDATTNECVDTESGKKYSMSVSGEKAVSGTITLDENGSASVYAGDDLNFNNYYCTGNSSQATCNKTKATK